MQGFPAHAPESLYSPVIDTDEYGPSRVNVADERGDPDSLWNSIRHMLSTRKEHGVLAWGSLEWKDGGNDRIAAFRRYHESQEILAVHNLSDSAENVGIANGAALRDLLTGRRFEAQELAQGLELEPYQYLWLTSDGGTAPSS